MEILPIKAEDKNEILKLCASALSHVSAPFETTMYLNKIVNWNISVKAVVDDKIVGCYLFSKTSLAEVSDQYWEYNKYKSLQGVALVVDSEHRGQGVGRALRDFPKSMDYDYIWGLQLKSLKNIDCWTKYGRSIVDDNVQGAGYLTFMWLKDIDKPAPVKQKEVIQKKWYTCGPSCIEIVADLYRVKYKDFDQLEALTECNDKTGTIDTGIKKALTGIGIENKQNTEAMDPKSAIKFLDEALESDNFFVMRTLTRGQKHWIVVIGKDESEYIIKDPWLGHIYYTKQQIIDIWQPRNFDGFVAYRPKK